MYTTEMLESIKTGGSDPRRKTSRMEPRRMTADEKDALLARLTTPTISKSEFDTLKIGPNKGEKVPHELCGNASGAQPHQGGRR